MTTPWDLAANLKDVFLDMAWLSLLLIVGAGLFMDYLVAASIAAISFHIVWAYRWPLLLMSLLAGLATYAFHRWLMWRAFDDYHFERFIGIFGDLTGTINSGLVLERVTDPHFETPVAEDLVYGSGVALLIGAPLLSYSFCL